MSRRDPPPIAEVRRGIECCFPTLSRTRVRPVPAAETGWDSFAYIVGSGSILKIARLPARPEMFTLLRRAGPRLARSLPLPIPLETHFSPRCRTLGVPIVVTLRIPGQQLRPVRFARLTSLERAQAARDLGRFLAALHRFPVSEARRAGARSWSRRNMARVLDRVRRNVFPRLEKAERTWASRLFADHLDDPALWRFPRRLIHGDLGGDHILIRKGKVTGVIDWGDAEVGDPAADFGGLVISYGEKFARETMRHYHAPSEGLMRRPLDFYLPALPLRHLDFGVRTGQPALVRRARRQLREAIRGEPPHW